MDLNEKRSLKGGAGVSEPEGVERRCATRVRTIYRMARITTQADAGFCLVHNLSDQGAMVETQLALAVSVAGYDGIWIQACCQSRAGPNRPDVEQCLGQSRTGLLDLPSLCLLAIRSAKSGAS